MPPADDVTVAISLWITGGAAAGLLVCWLFGKLWR